MKLSLLLFLALTATSLVHAKASLDCSSLGYDSSKKIQSLGDTIGVDCLILQHYRQTSFKPIDPLSDMALTCLAANYPKRILWAFQKKTSENNEKVRKFYDAAELGQKCADYAFESATKRNLNYLTTDNKWGDMEEDLKRVLDMDLTDAAKELILNQIDAGKFSLEGHKKPIDKNAFIGFMNQIVKEESLNGIEPVITTSLKWSPEFKDFIGDKHKFFTNKSKLLIDLASGEAVKYMMSGQEEELYTFMMKAQEGSLYPHDLFRASYRLNQGDVYLTILTIQNLLSQHWLKPNRNKIDFITKLHPITHHIGADEDVFGTWYHLFGSMLYAYDAGGLKALFVTKIETLMSIAYGGSKNDFQENLINQQGAKIGAKFRRTLKREEWKAVIPGGEINPETYLTKNKFKKIDLKKIRSN